MNITTEYDCATSVAARVAGEDIKQDDYITVLNDVVEFPSFLWAASDSRLPPEEPVRVTFQPGHAGYPYRVITVCLPFVYAKRPKGGMEIFDTRTEQLVRLAPHSGRAVWLRLRKAAKKAARKKKDK